MRDKSLAELQKEIQKELAITDDYVALRLRLIGVKSGMTLAQEMVKRDSKIQFASAKAQFDVVIQCIMENERTNPMQLYPIEYNIEVLSSEDDTAKLEDFAW